MRDYFYLLLFCLLLPTANAEIYKSVDEEGNVIYKDTSDEKAEVFEPPSMNTVPMPEWKPAEPATETEKPDIAYRALRIASPADNGTARSNLGQVNVSIVLVPTLQAGHSIDVLLDGKAAVSRSRSLSMTLNGVGLGKHNLQVVVRGEGGAILKRSKTSTFFLHRFNNASPRARVKDPDDDRIYPGPQVDTFRPGPILPQVATE